MDSAARMLTHRYIGTVSKVYVEWDTSLLTDEEDDGGEVVYALAGTPNSFQLQARAFNTENFTLQAYLSNIATAGNPQGSTVNLGWTHDGDTNWILSGATGSFYSSGNLPSSWMRATLPSIGTRSLRELTIPGSHDTGLWFIDNNPTAFANCGNTCTQTVSVAQQLLLGARYFDLRPVISAGIFKSGHYSDAGSVLGWQGAPGEHFSDVISEINTFTASNAELIILSITHDRNTDAGYVPFTQGDWNRFLTQLRGLNYLYLVGTEQDLTTLPLNTFISRGPAVIVILGTPGDNTVKWGAFEGNGFYNASKQFKVYDSYSDTDDQGDMISDQLNKMALQRTSPSSPMFLLSWTLSLTDAESTAAALLPTTELIIRLALPANAALGEALFPKVTKNVFPNIIYIDNFATNFATVLAISINNITAPISLPPPPSPSPPVTSPGSAPHFGQCGGEFDPLLFMRTYINRDFL